MATQSAATPGRGAANDPTLASERFPRSTSGGHARVVKIQRARLIAAMIDACAVHGAANVTVARIVERAGVSRRTFYEIFADREECFLATFDEALERVSRHVLEADDARAPWEARIRSALTGLLSLLDSERATGQLLIMGSLAAGPKALERRRQALEPIVAFVDEGRKLAKTGATLPPLIAEGVVGGALSVLYGRLIDGAFWLEAPERPLIELVGPLVAMVVLPYLGSAAASRESTRGVSLRQPTEFEDAGPELLGEIGMRLTYRTVRVLTAIAARPGGSNRQLADDSGIADQGQVSKLLARLNGLGLIENRGSGGDRGGPNAWLLTEEGMRVERAINADLGVAPVL